MSELEESREEVAQLRRELHQAREALQECRRALQAAENTLGCIATWAQVQQAATTDALSYTSPRRADD